MHDQILDSYYANNARKLHRTVDKILSRFGGLYGKDRDDFYSLANEVFVDAINRYDDTQSFDGFLYTCLSRKIMSEITKRNTEKRRADRLAVSLDAPAGDEDGRCLGDLLTDSYDLESEIFGGVSAITEKLERYLATLSKRQRMVLDMLAYCYEAAEIQEMLHMDKRQYADELAVIRAYEKIKILL